MSHALDRNFLWEAISVYVNDVLYQNKIYSEHLTIQNIISNVHDNIFEFSLDINKHPCKFRYEFDSNVSIEGTLLIEDNKSKNAKRFKVERRNDSVRIGEGDAYHEIYIYGESRVIDIYVIQNKKYTVTSLSLSTSSAFSADADILNMTVQDNAVTNHNPLIERLLFAVSGAIDYDVTVCKDVIALKSPSIYMIIYDSGSMQVVSVDTKTAPNRVQAEIRPINSCFSQHFVYTLDSDRCEITEIIPTKNNPTAVRRIYSYHQDNKTKVITADNKSFSVKFDGNNIMFIKTL